MNLDEATVLLDPTPLALEMGYERLPGEALRVAARTDMHESTGEMFEWWFRWRCGTQKYIWWHPVDHIYSGWQRELADDTHVGSEHVVTEEFTGLPAGDLIVQFRAPEEFFPLDAYNKARKSGAVSCAVLARIGFGHQPDRRPDCAVLGGRLLHVGRDTPRGLALRSHFFIGYDLPEAGLSPEQAEEQTPVDFGTALLQHCCNEFTFLSRFLPSLHLAEHRDTRRPAVPW